MSTPEGGGGDGAPADGREGRARVSRRAALLIALGAVIVLGLGWALDGFGQLAPATRFANGQTQQVGLYRVALTLAPNPPHAGAPARLTLRVTDTTGGAAPVVTVRLSVAMPAMDMSPVTLVMVPDGAGGYTATTAFPMAGEWAVAARVAPVGAAAVQTTFDVAVR